MTLHPIIHGRVRGVPCRDSLHREAARLAVAGRVRSCRGIPETMAQRRP